MNNLLTLIKVQILSFFGINKMAHKKTNKGTAKMMGLGLTFVVMGALVFFLAYIYTKMFAELFAYFNQPKLVIAVVVTMAQAIMLFFGIANVNGVMFGFKDYDMLMSLPVKPSEIVISKIIYSYIADLFLSIMIMVPTLINVSNFVTLTSTEYILYILGTFLIPLLPLGIAFVLGTFFSVITARFKYKNIVQTISMILFVLVIFILSFMSGYMEENEEMLSSISVVANYFMANWFMKGLLEPLYMLFFALTSICSFVLPAVIIGVNFKKINTMLLTRKTGKSFTVKTDKERSQSKAILYREFKRLINCPVYALNSLVGAIMSVVISVLIAILLGTITGIEELSEVITVIMPFVIGWFATISPTTASSISIDGKDNWIYKSSPIRTEKILMSKLLLNYIIYMPVVCVSILILGIGLKVKILGILLSMAFALTLVYFSGVLGLLMNLRFPMLKWENEAVPVKRSMSMFLTMLISFITIALLGVLAYFIYEIGWYFSIIIPMVIVVLASAILTYTLVTKGVEMYNK